MKGTFSYVISLFLHNEKNKILHQQFPAKNLTAVNLRYYSRFPFGKIGRLFQSNGILPGHPDNTVPPDPE